MENRNEPPWRARQQRTLPRHPPSTVPSKRPADAQEAAWVADEDRFVLQQAKKKAAIRVKGGRAKPIDWLTVTLRLVDQTPQTLEEDDDDDIDYVDPEGVFEGLSEEQLRELEKDVDTFLALEGNKSNRDFWHTMKTICKDRRQEFTISAREARGVSSISTDIDGILSPKSFEELEGLEKQIKKKLDSNEPIDVDYWEHLLRRLIVWKARAKLRRVSQTIVKGRLDGLRKQQQEEATLVREKLQTILPRQSSAAPSVAQPSPTTQTAQLDPEPFLRVRPEDKALESLDEGVFLERVVTERRRVLKLGYVPMQQRLTEKPSHALVTKPATDATRGDDFSQATTALYEREVARGVNEDEEIFTGEEELLSTNKPHWANKYRPRKPRYFNRVQMGYEWNKYNQTHYDHDNPPPKIVQGYKFNIFYPDLIDRTKAPTYRIEREHGRKRGQSFAPAGEEDTCLIRFIAGPPYEDIAFRIVDREWDYSAKRERGFKSSFEKGILQLHFQFKKIYYRK